MTTKTSKALAAAAIATVMLSLSLANPAVATISDPLAHQKALVGAIVVAPASAEFSNASDTKAPLIRVAPHGCSGGCPNRHG
jgi:hypothetical protein